MKVYSQWYDRTEQLCREFNFTTLFSIGSAAQRKIAVALTYLTYQSGLLVDQKEQKILNKLTTIRSFQLYILVVKIWLEYFTFWLLWPMFRKGSSFQELVKNSPAQLWILNGTNSVDLFPNIKEIFSSRIVHKLFIPNKHLLTKPQSSVWSHSFVDPIYPTINILLQMFQWIQSNKCSSFLEQFLNGYSLKDPEQLYFRLADQLLRLFYHREWAIYNAKNLHVNSTARIVLMENDFFGNLMFLTEELNKLDFETIHVQHGFMDDPNHYFPLCKYIFVNSEKDRNLLIAEGLDPKRAIITGAPLQVLHNGQDKNIENDTECDVVILAAWGNPELQEKYIQSIVQNYDLIQGKRVILRLHPSLPLAQKNNWINKLQKVANISNGKTLLQDIKTSTIVISFSIDAMITSMRIRKPTILYIGDPLIYYRTLNDLHGLKCVYNVSEMRVAIKEMLVDKLMIQSREEEMEKIFGSTSVNVVKKRMNDFIDTILQ